MCACACVRWQRGAGGVGAAAAVWLGWASGARLSEQGGMHANSAAAALCSHVCPACPDYGVVACWGLDGSQEAAVIRTLATKAADSPVDAAEMEVDQVWAAAQAAEGRSAGWRCACEHALDRGSKGVRARGVRRTPWRCACIHACRRCIHTSTLAAFMHAAAVSVLLALPTLLPAPRSLSSTTARWSGRTSRTTPSHCTARPRATTRRVAAGAALQQGPLAPPLRISSHSALHPARCIIDAESITSHHLHAHCRR